VTVEDAYIATAQKVHQALVETSEPWVRRGAAVLSGAEDGGEFELRPVRADACAVTVVVQGAAEVSFFPTAPGTQRTPSIDVYNEDARGLIDEVRRYAVAFLSGSIEMTLRRGSSAGRVRVWLDDERVRTHLYNVPLGFLVGRGSGWETFKPSPY
jgi:hypothetical protein